MAGRNPWSTIRNKMTPEQRKRSEDLYEKKRIGLLVAEMRKQAGLTQTELGDRLGIGQSAISQMEASGDMHLTTVQKIITELGGEIVLHMPQGEVSLPQLAGE